MRRNVQHYIFPGVFAPVLSLEELMSRVDPESGGVTFDIPDTSILADVQLEREQASEAVSRFVQSLPPRDRAIVHRLFWGNATQTEIAVYFGVSKMAISKAMARISRLGREALAAHEHLAFMN